jgi:hypothetical protein
MKPMRQIEVAELLATASNFSVPYTKALLPATPGAAFFGSLSGKFLPRRYNRHVCAVSRCCSRSPL